MRLGLDADSSPSSNAGKQSRAILLLSLRAFVACKNGETCLFQHQTVVSQYAVTNFNTISTHHFIQGFNTVESETFLLQFNETGRVRQQLAGK
jgi:hypothetical protein